MSHRGSLLCLPDGIHGWSVTEAEAIDRASLAAVIAAAGDVDVLLIGTGASAAPIAASVRAELRAQGIVVEAMTTGAAVRTFNVLLGEERAVAAALIAVA